MVFFVLIPISPHYFVGFCRVCVFSFFVVDNGGWDHSKQQKDPTQKNAKKYKKKHNNQTNCSEKCSVVVIFFFLLSAFFYSLSLFSFNQRRWTFLLRVMFRLTMTVL